MSSIKSIDEKSDEKDQRGLELPTEVWVQIFEYLSLNDVLSFSMSGLKFKKIIEKYILVPQFGEDFILSFEELNGENVDIGLSKIIEEVKDEEKVIKIQEFLISKGFLELTISRTKVRIMYK